MKLLFPLVFIFCLVSCAEQQKPDNSSKKYFDLQAFFSAEAKNLQKADPLVKKNISKNELKESKNTRIRNWTNELGLFSSSDINKTAWNDSYEIKTINNSTEYIAKDPDLRTRKIIIDQSGGKINHIFISNQTSNALYSSNEELDYYPDSLYLIRKKQHILLIGNNDYCISGKIK